MSSEKAHSTWRYRCPEGHCSWERNHNKYYCHKCNEAFGELKDMKQEPLRY